ncbi:unnamed protein product [Polarella glacialis]|uniref:Uncharacterized protein n=1 Tax=Polarella glacialis TaxID=89957 RepID=A0A813DV03_POLGL|nr:unnamed protein product [Polarella glacialis]
MSPQSLPTVSSRKNPAIQKPRKKMENASPNWFSSVSEKACAGMGKAAPRAPKATRGAAPRSEEAWETEAPAGGTKAGAKAPARSSSTTTTGSTGDAVRAAMVST